MKGNILFKESSEFCSHARSFILCGKVVFPSSAAVSGACGTRLAPQTGTSKPVCGLQDLGQSLKAILSSKVYGDNKRATMTVHGSS